MTEDIYIFQLRASWPRWPNVGGASLTTITLADEAVRAFPQSAKLWVMRGCLIQLGSESSPYPLEEALRSYQRAIEVNPQFAEAWEEIGYYYDVILADEAEGQRYFGEAERLRAIELSQRPMIKEQLNEQIRQAFAGVCLGNGIGLREGDGLDDYATAEDCAKYRELDEKTDWQKLCSEDLNQFHSSLSFFDAEGMRFHLPAYLLAELDGTYGFCLIYRLTSGDERFALLNKSQRNAVRAFLKFIEYEPDYEFDREDIHFAIASLWNE
jgi:tetratricopeptide (TPR) repeat protein